MNELPYPSDLTAAQWALTMRCFQHQNSKDESGELICARLRMPSFMCSKAASVGACCRAGRLVEWAEKTAQFVLNIVCKPKGTDWLLRFARALDRGANLRMAGQLPSPRSGLRDQSTHERGLDQNRYDTPHDAKASLSILRQALRPTCGGISVGLHRSKAPEFSTFNFGSSTQCR